MGRRMASLFEGVRAGKSESISELHRTLRTLARQVCRGGGPPGTPAIDWEDVAQECGRKLLAVGLDQYSGDGSERSYLYSVVRATVLEMARAASRRRCREVISVSNGPVPARDPNLEMDIRKILDALDPACREVIERVVLQDEPYADVARDLGMAESSVRGKLCRCLARARGIASEGRPS
jgi:RNA polymerase sigma factor (sigma-70 family)